MEWTIVDLKLIDAWSVLCFDKDDSTKEIADIVVEVKVPDKYKEDVSIRVANRRIKKLSTIQ